MHPSSSTSFDPQEFRRALGAFTTGVTVITTLGRDGQAIGLTANSFNSVSLDPPLVLWSLAKKAYSLPDFVAAPHWSVHVLSADQEAVSNQFARASEDKFAGIDTEISVHGIPLLKNCVARFECSTTFQYEGGDHIIFVGEVKAFQKNDLPPLVFHAGRYALASAKAAGMVAADEAEPPTFRADMLGYMFGRARNNFLDSMRGHLERYGLSDYEWRLLTILLTKKSLTLPMFEKFNKDAALETILQTLEALTEKGWVQTLGASQTQAANYVLTDKGVFEAVSLLAIAKAHEEQLLEKMGGADGRLLKNLLHQFIQKTEAGTPNLWSDEFVLQEKSTA